MGILGIFRKKIAPQQVEPKTASEGKSITLVSDLPALPQVQISKDILGMNNPQRSLAMIKAVHTELPSEVVDIVRKFRHPQGLVSTSFGLTIGGNYTPIIFFPVADKKSAGEFAFLKVFFKKQYKMDVHYYAPQKLPGASPVSCVVHLDIPDFQRRPEAKGVYASWWATKDDKIFTKSKSCKYLTETFKATEGIETWVFGAFCRRFDLVDDKAFRVNLPKEGEGLFVKGPDDVPMVVSCSKEKGIRICFEKDTPLEYREWMLENFMICCEDWRKLLIRKKAKMDEDVESLKHWEFLVETCLAEEKAKKEIDKVGMYVLMEKA